jgi:branched-chain amino acid transport system permease protein
MQRFIFGIILILVAIFRPNGLIAAKNRKADEQLIKDGSAQDAASFQKVNQQKGGIL